MSDPRYLRAHGVVIVSQRVRQAHSTPIGEYRGHPIWGSVRFMGMEYQRASFISNRGSSTPSASSYLLSLPLFPKGKRR